MNVIPINPDRPVNIGEPNEALISALRKALEMAEKGQLQSYIGVGFLVNGVRLASGSYRPHEAYPIIGALAWLQVQCAQRIDD